MYLHFTSALYTHIKKFILVKKILLSRLEKFSFFSLLNTVQSSVKANPTLMTQGKPVEQYRNTSHMLHAYYTRKEKEFQKI